MPVDRVGYKVGRELPRILIESEQAAALYFTSLRAALELAAFSRFMTNSHVAVMRERGDARFRETTWKTSARQFFFRVWASLLLRK